MSKKYSEEYLDKMKLCGIAEKYFDVEPQKIACRFINKQGSYKNEEESRKTLLSICQNPSWIQEKSPIFFLYGRDGSGKRSAGIHILRSLRETINPDTKLEYKVYCNSVEQFYSLKNEAMKSYSPNSIDLKRRDSLERIESCDALLLFGLNYSMAIKGFGVDPKLLISLLRERKNKQKFTIITSLFPIKELEKHSAFFSDIRDIVVNFDFSINQHFDNGDDF